VHAAFAQLDCDIAQSAMIFQAKPVASIRGGATGGAPKTVKILTRS
jgi:hypothetical protein